MVEVHLSSHVDPCAEAFKQNCQPPTSFDFLGFMLQSSILTFFLYVSLVLMSTNHVSMTFFLRARLIHILR